MKIVATTFIAVSLLITPQFAMAKKSCERLKSPEQVIQCYDKDTTAKQTKINNAIENAKGKYSSFQHQALFNSQDFWLQSHSAKCRAIYAENATAVAACLNDEWNKRLKIIQLDLKKVKPHQLTSFDFNDDQVMLLDAQINDLTKQFIAKIDTLDLNSQTKLQKQTHYQLSMDKWKRFASNYCKFNGAGLSCLLTLLNAKIEAMHKDQQLLLAK